MLSPLWLEDLSYHRYIFLIAILTYSCFSLMCINYFNILLLPKSGASCRGWKSTYCQPSQYSRALGMPAPWFIHTQVARIYRVNSLLSQSVPIGRSKWLKFSSKYKWIYLLHLRNPFQKRMQTASTSRRKPAESRRRPRRGEGGVEYFEVYRRLLSSSGSHGRMMARLARMISIKRLCLKRRSPLKEWRKIVL